MKKVFKICLLCMFAFLFCTGCDGTVTRNIRHAGFNLSSSFKCGKFFPRDKDDIYYEKIRYFLSNQLIDADGKIYELSLSQEYSNGENCMEAATSIRVQAIFDTTVVKGIDGKYYYLAAQNNVASYTAVSNTDNGYAIINILLKDSDVVKAMTASGDGLYYVLKTDGNIYAYTITSSNQNRNTPPRLTGTQIAYDKNDYGGDIIDFNYAGDSLNTFVRTADKVFRMRMKNAKECTKYADVACEFELREDPMFEKYKDRIVAYNGSVLITDYKKVFTVAS